jgi:hypothetical protein
MQIDKSPFEFKSDELGIDNNYSINLMGSNNSSAIESRSLLPQNWLPREGEGNVLVNRITHQ